MTERQDCRRVYSSKKDIVDIDGNQYVVLEEKLHRIIKNGDRTVNGNAWGCSLKDFEEEIHRWYFVKNLFQPPEWILEGSIYVYAVIVP